jgi:pimeloyl-ACP methyl ester carboxylesterase
MLIHSVGTDLSLWDKVLRFLAQNFQVLRYGVRGHGASEQRKASTPFLCSAMIYSVSRTLWDGTDSRLAAYPLEE